MFKSLIKYQLLILGLPLLFHLPVQSQFYNGHQMKFGKNRVQYNDFIWFFYRYEDFDVYFNQDGKALASYTADFILEEQERIEDYFDYELEKRLIFIVYNKLSDYRQSNIGLVTDEDETNMGGKTQINKNKVFIFFEGDHKEMEKQITEGITRILILEMLYGSALRENVTNSTLINLPDWFLEGLISYIADPWNVDFENRVKDGILSGEYEKFNRLQGEDAVYAGHSFWHFIAETYGESVIPNILYLTRINKNSNSGFLYVLGLKIKDLSYEWLGYYLNKFDPERTDRTMPPGDRLLKRSKKDRVYTEFSISPNGRYISYVTNEDGKVYIWLYDTDTGKKIKVLKQGHKLEQITDYSYPILAWHPSSLILSYIMEEKGFIRLYYYNIEEDRYTWRNIFFFEKILDYSFSDDGLKIVVSAIKSGFVDIYVYTIASATNEKVTGDIYDDLNPRFIDNSGKIIFASNRPTDTSVVTEGALNARYLTYDLYVYDYAGRSDSLVKITDARFANGVEPIEISHNQFIYLTDQNGITNRFLAKYDSVISFIDTTTHYRYFSTTRPLTNYRRNILGHTYSKETNQLVESVFKDGRYQGYISELNTGRSSYSGEFETTDYFRERKKTLAERDSLAGVEKETISIKEAREGTLITRGDTLKLDHEFVDINNYIFEIEKLNYYNEKFSRDNLNIVLDTADAAGRPKPRIYQTAFYTNYLVNQIDFSFLNDYYQPYTFGAVYFNPGFNLHFKLGAHDLFEDYRITGGVRLATDFDSNEYLLSIENLKRRMNKQLIIHRQVYKNVINSYDDSGVNALVKTTSHNVHMAFKWPFSQVAALRGTGMFRVDNTVFLSTSLSFLNEPNFLRTWGGLKMEYIFDNTRNPGINLHQGTRYKVFWEFYKQLNERQSDLFTAGIDFRHYINIHRNLIWANRFAFGTSWGSAPLIYYLGAVDNWINFSARVPTFDETIQPDPDQNYAFQTAATNMRGFTQNIRNGNNFALINSELRWPLIRYFANHPLGSNFWNSLQLVGFFDIGTAWTGLTPYEGKNSYDTEVLENGPVKVTIDTNREPIVMGYGFGARAMLLGYFIRADWAWGIENNVILPRIFYLSLVLDF